MQIIRPSTLYIVSYTILRIYTFHTQYASPQYQYSVLHTCFVCCKALSITFITLASSLLKSECSLYLANIFFKRRFPFNCSLSSMSFSLYFFILFYFSIRFLSSYVSLQITFKSVLGNAFGKSANHRGMNMDAEVVIFEEQDGIPKVVTTATISCRRVTDPDEFNRRLHAVDLNLGSCSDLIVRKSVAIRNGSFSIPYLHEFHFTPIDDVLETLRNVSKYDFYVWESQLMKALGNKSTYVSSKNSFK